MTDKLKELHEPVLTPGESWHLGRMDALQTATRILRKYGRRPSVALADVVQAMERDLVELTEASLGGYYDSAGQVWAGGEAPVVVFDRNLGVPMICRPRPPVGGWGIVDLTDSDGGQTMILATPFRAIDLKALPDGTQLVKIRDPQHSALASVIEVLECMRRDLDAAAMAESESDALRRAGRLLVVYMSAASIALSKLDDDDFVDWKATVPQTDDIAKCHLAICKVTTKAKAQAAVALRLCAMWLASRREIAIGREEGLQMDALMGMVDAAIFKMRPLLDSMNRFLSNTDAANADCLVVMSHSTGSIPVLAAIPKRASRPVALRAEA